MNYSTILRTLISLICLLSLPLFAQDRSEWFEFYLPWDDSSRTITDLSGYLDPPAGKHGFLQITPEGHFKFENSNCHERFVGVVNVALSNYPTHSEARIIANRMAKFGINLVRIHLIDVDGQYGLFKNSSQNTVELDPVRLDKMDYFLKCLKDKGIYFNFCIHAGRVFKMGDGIEAPVQNSQSKFVSLFNETLIDLQKDFAQKTLNHVNPYTGLTYSNDPALATLELTNENSLFLGWLSWQSDYIFGDHPNGIGEYYSTELDDRFNTWLLQKYGTDEILRTAWVGAAGTGTEILKNGSFENGLQNWDSYIHSAAGASGSITVVSAEAYAGQKSCQIKVNSKGTANWHVLVKPRPFSVEQGQDYKVIFYLKSSNPQPFQIEIMKHGTWEWFGAFPFQATNTWKLYELYFTAAKTMVDSFVVQWNFGTSLGTFWLDAVSITTTGGVGLEPGESLTQKNIKRTKRAEIGKHSARRVGDNAEFYFDLEGQYIESLSRYLKQVLGVKCPITFTNNYFGLAAIYSQSRADYMDTHFYWDHPSVPGGWSDYNWTMHNRSMLKDVYGSTLIDMPLCKVYQRPLVVSEYNHPFPSVYQAEAPGLLYAYGGFFDLDGILWHAYYDYHNHFDQRWQDLFFDIAMNPIVMSQFILSVPYRNGRIQTPQKMILANYQTQDIFDRTKVFQSSSLLNFPGYQKSSYFLVDGFAHGQFNAAVTELSGAVTDFGNVITSSTGELHWDGSNGQFTINNRYWQGAIGFLRNATLDLESIQITQIKTTDREDFAAIHLVSMDERPLNRSRRMVLVTTARLENHGQQWNAERTSLINHGGGYALCEPIYGKFSFKGADPDSFRVFVLDETGARASEHDVTFVDNTATFELGQKTLWYEIVNSGSGPAGVMTPAARHSDFRVYQNYPNPFNATTIIKFESNFTGNAGLRLFDCNGRLVLEQTLTVEKNKLYQQALNLSAFASGIYFYELALPAGKRTIRKMILMK